MSLQTLATVAIGASQGIAFAIGEDGVVTVTGAGPITGFAFTFTIKKRSTDATALLSRIGVITDAINGVINFTLTAADTVTFTPDLYVYDVWQTDAGGYRKQIVRPASLTLEESVRGTADIPTTPTPIPITLLGAPALGGVDFAALTEHPVGTLSWQLPTGKAIAVGGSIVNPSRGTLNFVSGATVVDNAGAQRTDVTISALPAGGVAGQLLSSDGAGGGLWQAGGDLAVPAGAGTVTIGKIQGTALYATTPAYGDVLVYVNTRSIAGWKNIPLTLVGGDVSGTVAPNASLTVTALQGNAVSATAPTTGYALTWNGTAWAPAAIPNPTLASLAGTQSANAVYAGPVNGVPATPAFRALVGSDLPATGTPGTYNTVTTDGTGRVIGGSNAAYLTSAVTSVGLATAGLIHGVTGSPVTGSGTLTLTLLNQAANTFFAGPTSGAATTPTMRGLVAADIPALPESAITNLTTDLAAKATDTLVAHLAGAETLTGAKTFSALLTGTAGASLTGGVVTLTSNAAATWSTSAGALTLTSAAAATWDTAGGTVKAAHFIPSAAGAVGFADSVATSLTIGGANIGAGGITITGNGSGYTTFGGNSIRPGTDGALANGDATHRWNGVWATAIRSYYFDTDAAPNALSFGTSIATSITIGGANITGNVLLQGALATGAVTLKTLATEGVASVATIVDTSTAWTSGSTPSKLLSIRNNGVEKASIDYAGNYDAPSGGTIRFQSYNSHGIEVAPTLASLINTGTTVFRWGAQLTAFNQRSMVYSVTSVADAAYTVTNKDHIVQYTTLTAARIVTLPLANYAFPEFGANPGREIRIMDLSGNAGTNAITITAAGTDTINGAATIVINTAYGVKTLVGNGVGKWVAY